MVDSTKMKMLNGWVLVLPDKHYETIQRSGNDTGLFVSNLEYGKDNRGDQMVYDRKEKHYSTKGKVLAVPPSCGYLSHKIKKLYDKYKSLDGIVYEHSEQLSSMNRATSHYNVPVEIEVGDEVLFSYSIFVGQGVQEVYTEQGTAILIRYDRLVAVMKEGELVRTLNGYVFVKDVENDTETNTGLTVHRRNKYRTNRNKRVSVVRCVKPGCLVDGYHEYSNEKDKVFDLKEGDYLVVDPRKKANVEPTYHQFLGPDMFMVHRRDIRLYGSEMADMGIDYKSVTL